MKATKAAFISGLASLAVLGIHTGAYAQQPPPPAPPAVEPVYPPAPPPEEAPGQAQPQPNAQPGEYPPGYGPPPGYQQPPPPSGYAAPAPRYYYPPPPPRYYGRRYTYYPPPPPPPAYSLERPFMLGGSLGLATLHYQSDSGDPSTNAAVGYSLRLGFGIAPRTLFLIEINGAAASDTNVYGYSVAYDQTLYDLGLQFFVTRKFFLRGGAGLGNIRAFDDGGTFKGEVGFGLTASAGVELLQGYNWSFELAAQWISGFYSNETWSSGAINLGFNFF